MKKEIELKTHIKEVLIKWDNGLINFVDDLFSLANDYAIDNKIPLLNENTILVLTQTFKSLEGFIDKMTNSYKIGDSYFIIDNVYGSLFSYDKILDYIDVDKLTQYVYEHYEHYKRYFL